MQGDGHVHVFLDDIVVVASMVIGPIDPRYHTGMDPVRIINPAWLANIRDQCRLYDVGQLTDDGHTPRCVPAAIYLHLVLIGNYTVVAVSTIEARSTLFSFDVRLTDQDKETILGLQQGGVAPSIVISVWSDGWTIEARYWFCLGCCGEGKETFVGLSPLLYPTTCPLGYMIDSLLFPWFLVLQVVVLITKSNAVVVQSDNQTSILVAQRNLVLIGRWCNGDVCQLSCGSRL